MRLFYLPNIDGDDFMLDAEESRHCVKVMRKKAGDSIHLTDGKGNAIEAVLVNTNGKQCACRIIQKHFVENTAPPIHIAIAPTKSTDRIEWFVEKAVEIGVRKISLIQSRYSERSHAKVQRLQKKAISAMKQSLRYYLPEIVEIQKLENIINNSDEQSRFIAHLKDENTPSIISSSDMRNSTIVLIGPEGGFSENELQLAGERGFKMVKIGDHRLRTETAGVVACTLLNAMTQLK